MMPLIKVSSRRLSRRYTCIRAGALTRGSQSCVHLPLPTRQQPADGKLGSSTAVLKSHSCCSSQTRSKNFRWCRTCQLLGGRHLGSSGSGPNLLRQPAVERSVPRRDSLAKLLNLNTPNGLVFHGAVLHGPCIDLADSGHSAAVLCALGVFAGAVSCASSPAASGAA